MMTFIKANDLSSFVTLRTLKVLKILTFLNIETELEPPDRKRISINEINTIKPSKTFIISLR